MAQIFDNTHYNAADLALSGSPLLTATQIHNVDEWAPVYCTEFFTTGKFYYEVSLDVGGRCQVGCGNSSGHVSALPLGFSETNSMGASLGNDGTVYASPNSYTIPLLTGPVFGCALNLTNGLAWWKDVTANGSWYGASTSAGDPTTNSGGAVIQSAILAGATAAAALIFVNSAVTARFASGSWSGTPPTGYTGFDSAPPSSGAGFTHFGPFLGISPAAVAAGAGAKLLRDVARNPLRTRRRFLVDDK